MCEGEKLYCFLPHMDTSSNEGWTHRNTVPFDSDRARFLLDSLLLLPSIYYSVVNQFSCSLYFWPSFASASLWLSCSFSFSPISTPSHSFLALLPPQIYSPSTRWTRHIPATQPHPGITPPLRHPHGAMALLPWAWTCKKHTPILLTRTLSATEKAITPSFAFIAARLLLESFITSKVVSPAAAQVGSRWQYPL